MRVSDNAAHPLVRPITRYVDLYEMRRAWRELSGVLEAASYDAVWLNPCRYLQAPAISDAVAVKSVYYCDEPARAYHDPSVTNATRPLTRPLYLPLHRTKRRIDIDRSQAVAAIVTNSHYSAQMIEQAYGRRASIDPLGVDDRFSPGGESTSRVHALSVGSLIPSKGHDLAIESIARSSSKLPLLIIAPRPSDDEQRRLEGIARRLGVEVSVRIGVEDDELIAAYRSAAITIYLARSEPFGLVSLEAQACGSPVVVADEGGLPETISGGAAGRAVPRDAGAAAAAIDALSTHRRPDQERARAAEISKRWSWIRSATILADHLREVAG